VRIDVLGEDDLALLSRRFERMHENLISSRRNSRTCFKCGKTGHFFAECPKMNNDKKYKSKDRRRRSKKKDRGHGRKAQTREKIKKSSDVESDSEDTLSSSSDEEEEADKRKKNKTLSKHFNGICVTGLSSSRKDGFCGMARSSSSNRIQKYDSNSDSEDEVCDELSSLRKENEELVALLDNRDDMFREAKKLRKELRALLEEGNEKIVD
jgi:hypothetical protein